MPRLRRTVIAVVAVAAAAVGSARRADRLPLAAAQTTAAPVVVDAFGGSAGPVAPLDDRTVVATLGGRVVTLGVDAAAALRPLGASAALEAAPRALAVGGAGDGARAVPPPLGLALLADGSVAIVDLGDVGRPRLAGRICLAAASPSLPLALAPPASPLAACGDGPQRRIDAVALRADGTVGIAAAGADVVVFDVGAHRQPRAIGWLDLGAAVVALAVDGDRLVALAQRGDAVPDGLFVDAADVIALVDLTDPTRPIRRGWLKLDGGAGWFWGVAAGGGVAMAVGTGGGAVVDTRDPDRPRLAARIDRFAPAVAMATDSGRPVAALALGRTIDPETDDFPAIYDDLVWLDLSVPSAPRALARHWRRAERTTDQLALMPGAGRARVVGVDVTGVTAYTATTGGALVGQGRIAAGRAMHLAVDAAGRAVVVEGSEISGRLAVYGAGAPMPTGGVEGLDHPLDLAVTDDHAFVAEGVGLRTVALVPVGPPRTVGYAADPEHLGERIAAGPGWLAVASRDGTVRILDAGAPDALRTRAALAPAGANVLPAVAVDGHRLFVADAEQLIAVDVADPDAPRVASAAGHGVRPGGDPFHHPHLAVADGRAWVVDAAGGVVVYDVRGPQPQRLALWDDLGAHAVAAQGESAVVAISPRVDDPAFGRVARLAAPWGGRAAVTARWTTPAQVNDLAFDADGTLVIANDDYGVTRWQPRQSVTATATSTVAPALPPRPTATAAAPDPSRPFRAFLPLAVRATGAAASAPDALHMRRTVGGTTSSVAIDGAHAFVAEGQSIVALRIGGRPTVTGPIVLADVSLDRPVRSLAAGAGWLAALVGPTTALTAGLATIGAGEPSLYLVDTSEPQRPRAAGRVPLPGAAVDVAVGHGASERFAAVVGHGDDGAFFALVDAADLDAPSAVIVPLAADEVPLGVALDGARAVVQSARGATSALTLVDVGDPRRPSVLGTVGGLPPAVRAGAVAMRGGPAFAVIGERVVVADVTGTALKPRVPSFVTPDGVFPTSLTQVAADGDEAWLLTRTGSLLRLTLRADDPALIDTAMVEHGDHFAVGRALALSRDAIVVVGGERPETRVLARAQFDAEPTTAAGDARDGVLAGRRDGLGGVYAVAGGPPHDPLVYAALADGRLQAVAIERDRPGALGQAIVAGLQAPPWPPEDAATEGDLGVWVAPRTALRSHLLLGRLSVARGEASVANEDGSVVDHGPITSLRMIPTQRRVAIADGFAWVSERSAGLAVFDLDDPTRLAPVGRMETPGQPRGLAVRDGWVFVADGTAGLTVLDARNPAAPFEAGHLALPGAASAVSLAADGKAAFVAVEAADGAWLGGGRDRAALWTIDVRQPTAPRAVDSVGLGLARVAGIAGDGRWRYVAGAADVPGGGPAVVAVDVAGAPRVAAAWRGAPGAAAARGVAVVGPFVVAALGVDGMAVLDAPR